MEVFGAAGVTAEVGAPLAAGGAAAPLAMAFKSSSKKAYSKVNSVLIR